MSRLIILDRDGVINQDSDDYIKSVDEFIPLPGSLEAIAQLCQADYAVMVATNQSGIARQFFTLETLKAMHAKLQLLLAPLGGKIAQFYYCPQFYTQLFPNIHHDVALKRESLSILYLN